MSNKTLDILDNLARSTSLIESDDNNDDFLIPKRCAVCKNNVLCNIFSQFCNISRIGITVSVEKCRYFTQIQVTKTN
jgi:hypothetical protein